MAPAAGARRLAVAVLAAAAVSAAAPGHAGAAPARLQVDPGDRTVRIVAVAGDRQNLHGIVRIRALRRFRDFIVLREELRRDGGEELIRRSDILLQAADGGRPRKNLQQGAIRTFRIAVRNVPMPGVYRGRLTLLVRPNERHQIQLVVRVVPVNLTATTPAVHIRVAHCPEGLTAVISCDVFRGLVPSRWFDDDRQVALLATPSAPVTVQQVEALLVNEDGDRLPKDVVDPGIDTPIRFRKARIIEVPITVDRERIAPGTYAGTLRLYVQGLPEPVLVAVDLNVRPEPVIPLALIIVGIVLGRLLRRLHADTDELPTAEEEAAAAPAAAGATPPPAGAVAPRTRKVRFVEVVTGIRRRAPGWGARATMGLILLALLSAFGFHTLYGMGAAGFGGGSLGDYLTLVAWGLSADVASRTIANFSGRPID